MWIFGSFLSIESVMVYNHLIFCQLLLLLHLIFPSIRVFANESVLLIRWPKYWSFNFSISPMNIQDWFPLGLTGMISLQSKGISRIFTSMAVWKHQFLYTQPSLWSSSHIHTWLLEKTIALTRQTYVSKVMSLLFSMLSRFLITFLPRSKHLLISWLQSTLCNDFGVQENKVCHCFHHVPIYLPWSDGTGYHDLHFSNGEPTFSLSSFTFIKRFFSSSSLSAIRVVSSAYLRLLIFLLPILIPACASFSPVFLMMYSAFKLNRHSDNIQPWHTLLPVWNQSVVPCPILTVASWPAYRFLRRQVRWSGIPISFRIFHSLLWSTQLKTLA